MQLHNLRHTFDGIKSYAKWIKLSCAKCKKQRSGQSYGCQLLRAMDIAVSSMTWEIDVEARKSCGFPETHSPVPGVKCSSWESYNPKKIKKPKDEVAP